MRARTTQKQTEIKADDRRLFNPGDEQNHAREVGVWMSIPIELTTLLPICYTFDGERAQKSLAAMLALSLNML